MCEPSVLLALQVAQAGASYESQRQTASASADAIRKSTAMAQADLVRQQSQIDAQARQQLNAHARQAARDMALFDVVTGEFGGGNSASRARAVSEVQQGEDQSTIATNRDNAQMENRFASLATKARADGQLASIRQPSLFETGLSIASAALDYQTRSNAKKVPLSG